MLEKLLLEEVGQRLARQPFQGFSWQQWAKYIQVDAVISETHPLWALENKVLENELSLFGVKPQQLEQQISDYRKKSRLIRWLLRLFSRINTKIAVWSYYRQCLSFRALSQREALSSPQKSDFPVDFAITQALLPCLRQEINQFEEMIDRHLRSVEISENKFLLRYQARAEKQEAKFFKLLEEQLKGVVNESERDLLRNTLKEEYRGMRKMMNELKESYLKRVKQVKERLALLMPSPTQQLVECEILYSEDRSRPSINISSLASSRMEQALAGPRLEDVNEIEVLMKEQQEEMERLLAQKDSPDKAAEIKSFLEDGFQKIRRIIQLRLGEHQALVDALQSGRLNYRQASQQSKALQQQLKPFFKKKVFLLFHPDKYDSANGPIKRILHELFIQIKNLYETSIAQLLKEIEIIQQKNDREETHEELLQKQKNFYRDILKDFIAVFDKYEQKVTAMYTEMGVKEEAHHIEMKAIMQAEIQEERQARMQAEMEAKQARMEAKQARIQAEMQAKVQEEIQARMENLERLLIASMALPQNQATASDASDNETAAATGYSFFPAGR